MPDILRVSRERKEKEMIRTKNLKKSFKDKTVLENIDLSVEKGSIVGLLGPSGAGKTTIIKILTGQLEYDGGSVEVFGKEASSLSGEDKKRFGIMMDRFGLYDRLTCGDNLKIFADIYGINHSKIKETLFEVGLEDAYKKSAANLSKGMRARLLLARVFMHSPEIIFLDEPTSGLDPQSMRAIHKIILKKKEEGCTIFLTTHNMEEANKLCDNIFLLNEGKIVEKGTPEDICRRYNFNKKIKLHLTNGRDLELSQESTDTAREVFELLNNGEISTIHSTEPTLETVFLQLTGKALEEE